MAGFVGSTRAPRPSSVRSKAGSTLVPPGATRPRISETASTASTSAATESSSHAPRPAPMPPPPGGTSAKRVADLVEDPGVASRRDRLARLGRVVREQLALALRELGRDDDVDEDVEITA